MVLHKSLLPTLLTSSACVILFGVILAFPLHDPFNVLSGAAAYAAVLVVFVGTSGP
jgi:TRAP-type C4-dicarboxylate transport system permease small subunit